LGKNPRKLQRIWEGKNGDLSEFFSTRVLRKEFLGWKDLDMDINNQIYIKTLNGRLLN
jgi:hypothetical protein